MASERRLNLWWRTGEAGGLALFRRVRALRGTGAVLGAVALLIQFWLPLVHHPVLAAQDDQPAHARLAAVIGGEFTLCLAPRGGAQERSGTPGPAPSHGSAPCPICQALHAIGSFIPPAGTVLAEGPGLAVPGDDIGQARIAAHPLDPTSQPRAPPVMA